MKRSRPKKIIVSVTNDLITDQRVHKVCCSLEKIGYQVLLVGRQLPSSPAMSERSYATKRMRLLFKRSILFYAEYNIRLFSLLLFTKADAFLSNDLDTLPANYLAAKLKGVRIYYDSHEYFTEVPELINRPRVRKVWERIERLILPELKHTYTVSPAVAEAYNKKYNINMMVVRNFPKLNREMEPTHLKIGEEGKFSILYQGVVNVDRGLEEAVEAMKYLPEAILYIAGRGDIDEALRKQVRNFGLADRVKFLGAIPFEQLPAVTAQADLGLSIEKSVGLNYKYALPNKLFDYIHAGVPVLVSPLPEILKIMEQFRLGGCIDDHDPYHMAEKMRELLLDNSLREEIRYGLARAKETFCWEREEEVLRKIFQS